MEELSELYGSLNSRAIEIVSYECRETSPAERKVLAHDITVDFLMFSESFRSRFDPKLGGLLPFFGSYTRKKIFGVRSRGMKARQRFKSVEEFSELMEIGEEDNNFEWFEIEDRIRLWRKFLNKFCYKALNLEMLFVACLLSYLEYGKTDHKFLCEKLKISPNVLRGALAKMRNLLKEKVEAGIL